MEKTLLLADFLMVEVSQHCPVESLKNLRLVCRRFNALITAYQHSICFHVARKYFRSQEIELLRLCRPQALDLNFLFLLDWRSKNLFFLSEVLFRNSSFSALTLNQTITALEQNAIKSRFRNGFAVLWNFADIARDVRSDESALQERSMLVRQVVEDDLVKPSQPAYVKRIFRSWVDLVARLSLQQRKDYALMRYKLSEAFRGRFFGPAESEWFRLGSYTDYEDGDCWLSWFVLSTGPGFFLRAWKSTNERNACSSEVYETWAALSHDERLWQYRAGRETEASMTGYGDKEASGRMVCNQMWAELTFQLSDLEFEAYKQEPAFFLGTEMSWEDVVTWQDMTESPPDDLYPPLLMYIEPTRIQIAARDEVRPWIEKEPHGRDVQKQKWLDIISPELTYAAGRPEGPGDESPDGMIQVLGPWA